MCVEAVTDHASRYLDAILRGSPDDAWRAVRAARDGGWSLEDVYLHQLRAMQRRLGVLWETGCIAVGGEQRAAAVTQTVLARLAAELPAPARARVVIAGVEGELHSLPAHLVADLLQLRGFDVRFLGTNRAEATIIETVAAERPRAVGLSTTTEATLAATVELARRLRSRFPEVDVVIGGAAASRRGRHASEVGSAAFAVGGDLSRFERLDQV